MDLDHKKLKQVDPVKPQEEVDFAAQQGSSPFDPPDAYSQPILNGVAVEDMHPYLQGLVKEHTELTEILGRLDLLVVKIREERTISQESFTALREFFEYFDNDILDHHKREERDLFPVLRLRMLERGEHGSGPDPITPVTVMEREHIEAVRLSAVAFSFCALAHKLEDPASVEMVLAIALERCEALSKLMRLHVYRENRIVFVLAQEFMTIEELDALA